MRVGEQKTPIKRLNHFNVMNCLEFNLDITLYQLSNIHNALITIWNGKVYTDEGVMIQMTVLNGKDGSKFKKHKTFLKKV